MPHPSFLLSDYGPIIEIGYDAELGLEYRYDVALYDTTGHYGPWYGWHRIECQAEAIGIIRGTASPSQRPQSATCTVQLGQVPPELSPWWKDEKGDHPNRANLPFRVLITDGQTVFPIFTGWIDTWSEIDDADSEVATITASDGFKHLAMADLAEVPAVGAGEAAGSRINRILDRAGWNAPRDLALGSFPLQGTTLAKPALEEIFLTSDSEAGSCWIDTSGAFRFVDREWLAQKASQVSWIISDGSEPDGICASEIISTADDIDVENVIGLSRIGGTAVWKEDAASVKKYGRRTWSRFDLPLQNDADVVTAADIQLADRMSRDYHLQAITLHPLSEPRAWNILTRAELGDTVLVSRRRAESDLILTEFARIIGIDHGLTPTAVTTVLTLGPRIRQTLARYDDSNALYDVSKYSAV